MNNIILQMIETFVFIIAIVLAEEFVCCLVIKRQGRLTEYKEQKVKKAFYPYSFFLYKSKKYFFCIKPIIILLALIFIFAPI